MVLITDDRDGGGVPSVRLKLQHQPQQLLKVPGKVTQVHPTNTEESLSHSEYQGSCQEEDDDDDDGDDEEDFEEVDFEDLDDCRTIASDDSFYPPDDVFADSERTPSPESPEPLSFFQACCSNNAAIVRIMIRHGVKEEEVKQTDRNNRMGLLVACYQGFVDVVIALCQCPYLDVNWQDSEGNTALITAAQAGHITITNYLLNYYCGLDIERRNVHGFTALMKAAMQGRADCVRSLMLAGASLDAKDFGRNFTAREWALFTGRYETAWVMTRLMERSCPLQFTESGVAPLAPLVAKALEPRGCFQRISDTVRSIFSIANVTNPDDEGVIDHMVSVTTALRSPFIAVACHTVSTKSNKHINKCILSVFRKPGPDRHAPQALPKLPGHTGRQKLQRPPRTSLLPVHMVLRRSSVRPGFSIPKVRVSKAPPTTYEPEKIRRKSSAKDGGGHFLQIPKWRYKELKEERKRAEEAERRRLEAITKRHLASGKRK
uniref:Ankyrin repeat domain 33ba n=1 Tax=Neogobius melanostomus TaxID=47308 RepID=A0A8C6TIZ7_9GOBI